MLRSNSNAAKILNHFSGKGKFDLSAAAILISTSNHNTDNQHSRAKARQAIMKLNSLDKIIIYPGLRGGMETGQFQIK